MVLQQEFAINFLDAWQYFTRHLIAASSAARDKLKSCRFEANFETPIYMSYRSLMLDSPLDMRYRAVVSSVIMHFNLLCSEMGTSDGQNNALSYLIDLPASKLIFRTFKINSRVSC